MNISRFSSFAVFHPVSRSRADVLLLPVAELPSPSSDLDYALVVVADDLAAARAHRALDPDDRLAAPLPERGRYTPPSTSCGRGSCSCPPPRPPPWSWPDRAPFLTTMARTAASRTASSIAGCLVHLRPDQVVAAIGAVLEVDVIGQGGEPRILQETLDAQALVGRAFAPASHAEHPTSSPSGRGARPRSSSRTLH